MQEIKGNKIIVVRNNKDRIIRSKNLFSPVTTLAQHSSFPVVPFIFKFLYATRVKINQKI